MPELENAELYGSDSGDSDFDSEYWSGSELDEPGEGEEVEQPAPNPGSGGGDRSRVVLCDADKDWTSVYVTKEVFRTKELLIRWAKQTGFCHNQVLVCRTPTECGRPVEISCGSRGAYHRRKPRRAQPFRPSKQDSQEYGKGKVYCAFKLTGVFDTNADGWKIRVGYGCHGNHDILRQDAPDNSFVGGLTEPEKALIRELLVSRVKLRYMLMVIGKRFPKNVSKLPQVYAYIENLRDQRRMQLGRMRELMTLMNLHRYICYYRHSRGTETLSDLFFSHPSGQWLASLLPYVILIDSTKDTKRYDYPCLQIVGITPGWHNFSIASAFMTSGKEEHYTWVLQKLRTILKEPPIVILTDREKGLINAISHVFPESKHMLCREYIFRSIREHLKKKSQHASTTDAFVKECEALFNSRTILLFEKIHTKMRNKWRTRWRLRDYLEKVWLVPYKEKIVCAWTDQILHFGLNTTNMVESVHPHLEKFLHSTSDDLTKVWEAFHEVMEFQPREIGIHIIVDGMLQTRTARVHNFFKRISSFVSNYATRKVLEEWNALHSAAYQPMDHKTCRCTIKKTHALPCAHMLDFYLKTPPNELPIECFHVFWRQPLMMNERDENEVHRSKYFENKFNDFVGRIFPTLSEVQQERIIGFLMSHEVRQFNKVSDLESMLKSRKPRQQDLLALEYPIENVDHDQDTFDIREHSPDCFPVAAQTQGTSSQAFTHQSNSGRISSTDVFRATPVPIAQDPVFEEPDFLLNNRLPTYLRGFVTSWWDLRGDGNCGYRAIAKCLGLDQEAWPMVRRSLFLELFDHLTDTYWASLSNKGQKTLLHRIPHYDGPASIYHWFTDECAMIAAGAYNAVVVHLSKTGHSVTYLPMRWDDSRPPIPEKEIWILNLTSVATGLDHFKGMHMRADTPLPPLHPMWLANHQPRVAFLKAYYERRLSSWHMIVPPS